jgi:glyoxylase-like metal-dependent hydrolase (beta-lactamase superfamily II)
MQQLRFGDVTVNAVTDGELAMPLQLAYPTADLRAVRRLGGADEAGRTFAQLTTFIIRAAGQTVLVDTGMGPDIGPLAGFGITGTVGLLPGALREAAIAAEAVDAVVLTHLHADHIGWNTADLHGRQRPTFPNARYFVTRTEWQHRLAVAGEDGLARSLTPVEASGQLDLVDDGHPVAPGVSLLATPGHTPGHTSVLVMGGGAGAIITGDAAGHPISLEDPELQTSFDSDHPRAVASRLVLVERATAEGLVILGGHFPPPTAGRVVRVGARREWRWLGA